MQWQIGQGDIQVTAYDYLAGGIGSVKYKGVELIDNVHGVSDHGRQLQTAVQYKDSDGSQGESRNPTECGGSAVFIPGASASRLVGARITDLHQLETTCQAAYWLTFRGKTLSDTYISKSVMVMPWGLDYRVQIDPEGSDEAEATFFNAEVVTGYMPSTFTKGGFINPDGSVEELTAGHRTDPTRPCFLSNEDGSIAMGVLIDNHRQHGSGHYALLRFGHPDNVNKWSVVATDNTPDRIYHFRASVFIGTRNEVVSWLNGGNLPTQGGNNLTREEQYYLDNNSDVAHHHYFKDHPREHFDRYGRAEGRTAHHSWYAEVIDCDQDYLTRYPDVAADPYYGLNPREHFDREGRAEGRTACPEWTQGWVDFDACEQDYLNRYPDVAAHPTYGQDPHSHFEDWGYIDGRTACTEWSEVEPPISSNTEMVSIDTDMSVDGDPDDVQCYIAQASSWPILWDVRGIVSTVRSTKPSAKGFIQGIVSRMHNAVSATSYPIYPVYDGADAIQFYRDNFQQSHAENRTYTIFVWGSIKTLAQALQGTPASHLSGVTVYWVANWNRYSSPEYREGWERMKAHIHKLAGFYRDEEGFRGIMRSGNMSKLVVLQNYIQSSPVAPVYNDHPIPPADATYAGKWKAGDLSLYFYHRNQTFRDVLFLPDQYGGFVADGSRAEQMVAADGFRDEMTRIVKINVDRV